MPAASPLFSFSFVGYAVLTLSVVASAVVNLVLALRARAPERLENGTATPFYRHRAAFVLGCAAVILVAASLIAGGSLLMTSAFWESGVRTALKMPITRGEAAIAGVALIILNAQAWIFLRVSLSQLNRARDFCLAAVAIVQGMVVVRSMYDFESAPPTHVVAMASVLVLGSMILLEVVRRSTRKAESHVPSAALDGTEMPVI